MWPVVDPAGGAPSSAGGRAIYEATLPRSSRWAVERPMDQTRQPRPHRRQGCDLPPNTACCRNSGRNEIERDCRCRRRARNPPLTMEPYPMFGITRTEMESGAGVALARLAVAQVDPIGLTRGDDAKRTAVATPSSFHRSSPILVWPHFDQFCGLSSSRYEQKGRCRVDQESAAEANRVRSARPWILGDSQQMSFAATL
jgi:hypothetical protein